MAPSSLRGPIQCIQQDGLGVHGVEPVGGVGAGGSGHGGQALGQQRRYPVERCFQNAILRRRARWKRNGRVGPQQPAGQVAAAVGQQCVHHWRRAGQPAFRAAIRKVEQHAARAIAAQHRLQVWSVEQVDPGHGLQATQRLHRSQIGHAARWRGDVEANAPHGAPSRGPRQPGQAARAQVQATRDMQAS